MPDAPLKPAELALEQSGLEFLRAGKFRKARDSFKALNKTQPSRALPLLIEANLGLANELISKGLVSEANQVLAYLKTIAPASYNLDASTTKEASLDAWATMVPLATQRLSASTLPEAQVRAADQIILGAESPEQSGHPDAMAILSALEIGYGAEHTQLTAPLLRSVQRSSPFSHWVLFFKGMTALETGDHARAADCFRKIPDQSLLQASLPALLTLCGADKTQPPAPRVVRTLCSWADHPSLAEPLLHAETLWKSKRRTTAISHLMQKIPHLICWGAQGFKADLSRFLIHDYYCNRNAEFSSDSNLFDQIISRTYSAASAAIDSSFFSVKLSDFHCSPHFHFQEAHKKLNDMSCVVPICPAMMSRIYTRLAEQYINSAKTDPEDKSSPPSAKKALEEAIRHDPDHLQAWLMQCDLMSMGMDTSAYNRFLDALTKRFPSEKEVLIRNGDCCFERSSYTKSLRNFQNAAEIDSVDPRINRGIMRARLGIAEAAYRKGDPSKANWELIDSLATANQSYPEFSLWRLRARRIALEVNFIGKEAVYVSLASAAMPLAPSPFLFEVACRIRLSSFHVGFSQATLDTIFPSRPGPQSLKEFLAVIDETDLTEDEEALAYANTTARTIFAEHNQRLLEFVETREDLIALMLKIFSSKIPNIGLASSVIEKFLIREPEDSTLLYICLVYDFSFPPNIEDYDYEDLIPEIKDSKNPDDMRLIMLVEKNRRHRRSERMANYRQGQSEKFDLDYEPHGDNDDYDEDDDYDPNEILDKIKKATANMTPEEIISALANMIGGGLGGANAPQPKKITPQKKPTPVTDQLDFDLPFNLPPRP
jgi:tetratricopeptide (TPR) repeat protein